MVQILSRKIIIIPFLLIGLFFLGISSASAEERIFFSPQTNLEQIDIDLIDRSTRTIDIAMYAFTDRQIAAALIRAAERGVRIRIYRDDIQIRDRGDVTGILEGVPGIEIRIKNNKFWNIMHLKAFVIDGRILREGSANWSPAGEGASCFRGNCGYGQQQDNDLLITDDTSDIQNFEKTFERIWNRPKNQPQK